MSDTHYSKKTPDTGEDQLLDHAYDGIMEFDNPMPRWWVRMFWGTCVFSFAYLFHYWVGNGQSVNASYDQEMEVVHAARAKEAMAQKVSEEVLAQVMIDATSVASGAQIFASKCVTCHLEKGQGSIGPNLTDGHWIHGTGQLMDVFHTVSEGVAAKGMPAWSRQLTPAELRQVVAFVGTLRGTNVAGKAPEGTPAP
jgi:cytochrome c oxidase cbb3-type subunit III